MHEAMRDITFAEKVFRVPVLSASRLAGVESVFLQNNPSATVQDIQEHLAFRLLYMEYFEGRGAPMPDEVQWVQQLCAPHEAVPTLLSVLAAYGWVELSPASFGRFRAVRR